MNSSEFILTPTVIGGKLYWYRSTLCRCYTNVRVVMRSASFLWRSANVQTNGQFHQQITRAFFVRKFIQSKTLSREKLLKRLSNKKCVRKTLMKLTLRAEQTEALMRFSREWNEIVSTRNCRTVLILTNFCYVIRLIAPSYLFILNKNDKSFCYH